MIACNDFTRLLQAVEALGGKAPEQVVVALDSYDAFVAAAAQAAGGSFTPHLLTETLQGAVAAGEALTQETAFAAAKKAAVWQLVRKDLGEHLAGLDYVTATIVQAQLRGDAGDEMFASLQPVVDEAIGGIQRAASFFGPETTAEQVMEQGPRAVEVWNDAKQHQATLEQLLNTVLRPLQVNGELLPPELTTDHGPYLLAVWITPAAKAHLIAEVGSEFNRRTDVYSTPGGRWLAIHQLVGLRLNSPREAIEVLRSLVDTKRADDAERYAAHHRAAEASAARVRETLPPWSQKRRDAAADHAAAPAAGPLDPPDYEEPGDIGFSEDVNQPRPAGVGRG